MLNRYILYIAASVLVLGYVGYLNLRVKVLTAQNTSLKKEIERLKDENENLTSWTKRLSGRVDELATYAANLERIKRETDSKVSKYLSLCRSLISRSKPNETNSNRSCDDICSELNGLFGPQKSDPSPSGTHHTDPSDM